ncbi:MAG: hypothetical protein KIT43_00300 [Bauldia sp.]|nr:hypothetical protein [Bauldia sp.]
MIASLAGRPILIDSASRFALDAILPAIDHLLDPPPAPTEGDAIRWSIAEEDDAWRPDAFGPAGTYRIGGGGFAVVQNEPPSVESFLPGSGITLRAAREAFMAGDFRAHPASFALAAALSGPGRQVLHAGAVAHDGAAALLVGVGGVGKSTTALACAFAGADFLGDDLVLVDAAGPDGPGPTVHSLFATAKLNPDSVLALGVTGWTPIGTTPKNKAVLAIRDRLSVIRSAAIVALVLLAPPVTGRPRPQPLRAAEAMSLVMPSSIPVACRTGSPAELLAVVAALARRVPAWRLPLSWDLDALGTAVRGIVTEAADRLRRDVPRPGPGAAA